MFFFCSFSRSWTTSVCQDAAVEYSHTALLKHSPCKDRAKKYVQWKVWLSTLCFLPEQENKAILPEGTGSWSCLSRGVHNNKAWSNMSAPTGNVDDKVTNALHWSSQMAKSMEDLKSQFEVRLRNKQGISTFPENSLGIRWYLYPPWCHPMKLL